MCEADKHVHAIYRELMFLPVSSFMNLVFIFENITTGSMGGVKIYRPEHVFFFFGSSFIVTVMVLVLNVKFLVLVWLFVSQSRLGFLHRATGIYVTGST